MRKPDRYMKEMLGIANQVMDYTKYEANLNKNQMKVRKLKYLYNGKYG